MKKYTPTCITCTEKRHIQALSQHLHRIIIITSVKKGPFFHLVHRNPCQEHPRKAFDHRKNTSGAPDPPSFGPPKAYTPSNSASAWLSHTIRCENSAGATTKRTAAGPAAPERKPIPAAIIDREPNHVPMADQSHAYPSMHGDHAGHSANSANSGTTIRL